MDFNINGYTVTIDGNFILCNSIDGDLVVNGDLTINNNSSINNRTRKIHNANVKGNMYVKGPAEVENELIVEGDLRIQTIDSINYTGDEIYRESGGFMNLLDSSKLTVYGDFYTQALSDQNFASTADSAVFELHGNFKQVGTNTCFNQNNMTKILFAGEKEQHVSFDRNNNLVKLGRIQVENAHDRVWFDTPIRNVELDGDVTIKGDTVEIIDLNINGYTATIDGNLVFNGRNRIVMANNSDALVINGNLYNDTWVNSTIERGMLELKGDYIQSMANIHFGTGPDAYMQLTGDGSQTIKFPRFSTVYFHNLLIEKAQTNYMINNGEVPQFSFNQAQESGSYKKIWTNINQGSITPSVKIIEDTSIISITGRIIGNSSTVKVELKCPDGTIVTKTANVKKGLYTLKLTLNPDLEGIYELIVSASSMAVTPRIMFNKDDLEVVASNTLPTIITDRVMYHRVFD